MHSLILNEIARSATGRSCHVARDDKRMEAMRAALAFFAPDMPVFVFPGWDCLPYDRVSPNADICGGAGGDFGGAGAPDAGSGSCC